MLFVRDLSLMTAFYENVLGLRPIDGARSDDWVQFAAGNAWFALHAIPPSIACDPAVPQRPRENNPLRIDFAVADVERERTRLEALGVTVLVRPWGAYDAVDPEGNVFGLRPVTS
jgi:catechol 2,3-dioxygenase-like lactoylglutathione lyase family enzyme